MSDVAISPPSDIVLDVAQAVEKPDLDAARARLAESAGTRHAAETFSIAQTASTGAETAALHAQAIGHGVGKAAPDKDSFVKFEAMVLRNFVEAMMPKNTENVYGKGLAGDMWKSMTAQQIAGVMADRGGIGIADRLLAGYYKDGDRRVPLTGVDRSPEKAEIDARSLQSQALVQEIQREVMKTYGQPSVMAGSNNNDKS